MKQRIGSSRVLGTFACGAAVWLLASAAAAQPESPEPPPPVQPWTEALDLAAFADTYASVNFNLPKGNDGANQLRAYDANTGFALAWAGVDVSYDPAPVGGTLSLRAGPTAERLAASCLGGELARCDDDVLGLGLVKQAYASWAPIPALRLDLGKFDTPFGAEVAESQNNLTYSRGVVYWLGQPAFHTGLQATATLLPWLTARALLVNGWNNTIDNNAGKTVGAQVVLAPARELRVAVGWLGGPEQTDFARVECQPGSRYNPSVGACWPYVGPDGAAASGGFEVVDRGGANEWGAWRHLLNLVATYQPVPRLELSLDAVYVTEGVRVPVEFDSTTAPDGSVITPLGVAERAQAFGGGALAARYALTHSWAVAARGEYFADPDGRATGLSGLELVTTTLGLELAPTPALLLRLEGRGDFAVAADGTTSIFHAEARNLSSNQLTTTLGVVVRTF